MSGKSFFELIQRPANVGAIESQAKGVPFEHACGNCNMGHGLFAGCIQVPWESHCANCRMGGHHKRCSHLRVPTVPEQTANTPIKTLGITRLSPLKQALLRSTALKAPLEIEEKNIARLLEEENRE